MNAIELENRRKEVARKLAEEFLRGDHRRIAVTFRYSGQFMNRDENVAEHSWFVAFYSLMIYHRLLKDDPENPEILSPTFKGDLLERATMHDLDEMISGDFHRTFKYSDEEMRYHIERVLRTKVEQWVKALELPNSVINSITEAKSRGLAGEIISIADMIGVCSYVCENIEMGNRRAIAHAESVKEILSNLVRKGRITHPLLKEIAMAHVHEMSHLIHRLG
jgi:5'-deoxynucleotidase YfbR-like HD superfamily hydrolase